MEAEKGNNQQNLVEITLTVAEWNTVIDSLTHHIDYHYCKMSEFLANRLDKCNAEQLATLHRKTAEAAEQVRNVIDGVLRPEPPPETE